MLNLNIGDKIKTVGAYPTVGVIHSFGYIPMDINKKVFVKTDKADGLIAVDLVWNQIEKI